MNVPAGFSPVQVTIRGNTLLPHALLVEQALISDLELPGDCAYMADDSDRARLANFAKFDVYMDCLERLVALDLIDSPSADDDDSWKEGFPLRTKMSIIVRLSPT